MIMRNQKKQPGRPRKPAAAKRSGAQLTIRLTAAEKAAIVATAARAQTTVTDLIVERCSS